MLLTLVLFGFSGTIYGFWWSDNKDEPDKKVKIEERELDLEKTDEIHDVISIEHKPGIWVTDVKSKLSISHNERDLTLSIGYHGSKKPIKTFEFRTLAEMKLFMVALQPDRTCVSIAKIVDCDDKKSHQFKKPK